MIKYMEPSIHFRGVKTLIGILLPLKNDKYIKFQDFNT
jgi:hypothetical protein